MSVSICKTFVKSTCGKIQEWNRLQCHDTKFPNSQGHILASYRPRVYLPFCHLVELFWQWATWSKRLYRAFKFCSEAVQRRRHFLQRERLWKRREVEEENQQIPQPWDNKISTLKTQNLLCFPAYKSKQDNRVDCSFDQPPPPNKTCRVDLESFFPCVSNLDFGFRQLRPCVFIKFKKTTGFIPQFMNVSQLSKARLGFDYTNYIKENIVSKKPKQMVRLFHLLVVHL